MVDVEGGILAHELVGGGKQMIGGREVVVAFHVFGVVFLVEVVLSEQISLVVASASSGWKSR